jgi:hypothetical protein
MLTFDACKHTRTHICLLAEVRAFTTFGWTDWSNISHVYKYDERQTREDYEFEEEFHISEDPVRPQNRLQNDHNSRANERPLAGIMRRESPPKDVFYDSRANERYSGANFRGKSPLRDEYDVRVVADRPVGGNRDRAVGGNHGGPAGGNWRESPPRSDDMSHASSRKDGVHFTDDDSDVFYRERGFRYADLAPNQDAMLHRGMHEDVHYSASRQPDSHTSSLTTHNGGQRLPYTNSMVTMSDQITTASEDVIFAGSTASSGNATGIDGVNGNVHVRQRGDDGRSVDGRRGRPEANHDNQVHIKTSDYAESYHGYDLGSGLSYARIHGSSTGNESHARELDASGDMVLCSDVKGSPAGKDGKVERRGADRSPSDIIAQVCVCVSVRECYKVCVCLYLCAHRCYTCHKETSGWLLRSLVLVVKLL